MEPQEHNKDIFGGTKMSHHEEKPKEDHASFSKGLYSLLEGFAHIFKGFKYILFKKFYINVFLVLIIICASAAITYYAKENFKPATTVIFPENVDLSGFSKSDISNLLTESCSNNGLKDTLINVTCPGVSECEEVECEEVECPAVDCSDCPKEIERINVIYYTCPDGKIVNESNLCSGLPLELTSSDFETSQGILLAINNVDYEITGNDTGRIKRINYTIVNQGSFNLLPRVEVKLYKEWGPDVSLAKAIMIEDILGYNDWIIRADSSNIHFRDFDQTIRLELINKLNDESIVAVTKKLDIS